MIVWLSGLIMNVILMIKNIFSSGKENHETKSEKTEPHHFHGPPDDPPDPDVKRD